MNAYREEGPEQRLQKTITVLKGEKEDLIRNLQTAKEQLKTEIETNKTLKTQLNLKGIGVSLLWMLGLLSIPTIWVGSCSYDAKADVTKGVTPDGKAFFMIQGSEENVITKVAELCPGGYANTDPPKDVMKFGPNEVMFKVVCK